MRTPFSFYLLTSVLLGLTACSGGGGSDSSSDTTAPSANNIAPTIADTADTSIAFNSTLSLSIALADADTNSGNLSLSGSSSNSSLLNDSGIVVSGSGSMRTVVLTPTVGKSGSSTITLTVNDNAGGSAQDRFVLTVLPAVVTGGPVTTITTGPQASSSEPFAEFTFNSDTATHYECALDDGDYFACNSPLQLPHLNALNQYDRLAIGAHTVNIRGINGDGIVGADSHWPWTIGSIATADSDDFATQRLIDNEVLPVAATAGGWKGIFRINCEFDHAAYDDPIVFPGMTGAAHLHMFYGAKNVDANTTFDSLNRSTAAGCSGGVLNRSSYWMPALLAPSYSNAGERQLDANGAPAWKVIKAKVGEGDRSAEAAHEVFYYSAAVDDVDSIASPPIGLRIIAGNNSTTPDTAPQSTSIARWHCLSWASSDAAGGPWSSTIPECLVNTNTPDMLRFDIFFPSCWNGVDLDSANHKDHMAYPIVSGGKLVCPASHPHAVARISFHYSFPIFPYDVDPGTHTTKDYRLASDNYTVTGSNGGLSLHGDWFNGWHPEAMDLLVQGCIKGKRDCHDGNFALQSSTGAWSGSLSLGPLLDAKGSESIPEIINQGMGAGHQH